MIENGARNADFGAEKFGFRDLAAVCWNLGGPQLYEQALQRHEAHIAAHGPLVADTGAHTGRSPKDKFIVRDAKTDSAVWWDNNNAMTVGQFDALLADFLAHAGGRTLFAQDLYAGADPAFRLRTRVFAEYAWHSLFIRNLLIRPPAEDLSGFVPELTIVDLPSFRADPRRHGARTETVIACDFSRKIVLIGGSSYAGEMKKAVFTVLNYLLPPKQVMPMHCSTNSGKDGDTAIFLGLSGTGKTTLSADPHRTLIGDDEHGWGRSGVFNFEGGCYAKAIKLSREAEPEIHSTTERFGTVMENVTLDPDSRTPDFDDDSKTENARIAYPLHFIANASATGRAGHPRNIIMLTCDAFGVLPPIAKLDPAQAMYHFLSGYTAKVAGTEKGVTEPQATFSTCFGAPFLPLPPTDGLRKSLARPRGAPPCRLLARQYGVDRRQVRRRKADADSGDATPRRGRARRLATACGLPHRPAFWPRRADAGSRSRAAHPRSGQDLAQQG
jgi:phosphoenolpyruvate carboxykinase (ATP)